MPSAFDHLDSYKNLPEDVKVKINDKFNSLPEEDKQTIMQKINTPMGNRGFDAPLQDVSMTPLVQKDFNAADVTQGLTESGINPKLAKAVGVTFEMIPPVTDAVMTVGGAASLAKAGITSTPAMAEGIINSGVGKALRYTGAKEAERLAAEKLTIEGIEAGKQTKLSEGIKRAKDLSSSISDSLKNTSERELGNLKEAQAQLNLNKEKIVSGTKTALENVKTMAENTLESAKKNAEIPLTKLKESLKELPLKQRKVMESANDALLQAKGEIHFAEKALEIDPTKVGSDRIEHLLKDPQNFATTYSGLAERYSAKELAQSTDIQSLQSVRKAAEAARKNPANKIFAVELNKIESVYRNAISESSNQFSRAISNFKEASKTIKSLPQEFKNQKQMLQSGFQKMQSLVKEQVAGDTRVQQLSNAVDIMEKHLDRVSRRFAEQEQTLALRIAQAKNKVISNPNLTIIEKNLPIMEKKLYQMKVDSTQKLNSISVALQEAKNLAIAQTRLRFKIGVAAAAAGIASIGRKVVNKFTE